MTNYIVGRRLEYRIRNLFRKQGYLVIRAASSKPIDLVCVKNGKTVLVECKTGSSWLGKARKEELLDLSRQAGAPILLARRKGKRKVEYSILGDGRKFDQKELFSSIP